MKEGSNEQKDNPEEIKDYNKEEQTYILSGFPKELWDSKFADIMAEFFTMNWDPEFVWSGH